ncbi:MAG: hypothetical protein MUF18_15230 [Fimbriiglobus sp.]|nr:hypothetical protein [Fimbriiglobus sp.]
MSGLVEGPCPTLAALYRAAAERQAAVGRRWRRAALGAAAVAAGVLLVALLPRLEFRVNGQEFAVRWGTPPEPPVPPPDPRIEQLLDEQSQQLAALRAANAKQAELQDLLLTLAVDVSDRDKQHQARLKELGGRVAALKDDTDRRLTETEKVTDALLLAASDGAKAKGGE